MAVSKLTLEVKHRMNLPWGGSQVCRLSVPVPTLTPALSSKPCWSGWSRGIVGASVVFHVSHPDMRVATCERDR